MPVEEAPIDPEAMAATEGLVYSVRVDRRACLRIQ